MDSSRETLETWNKVASLYQDKFMDLDLYNETYNYFCKSLNGKSKVLDIGCGPGNITKYLLSKRPDFDVYGIDSSTNMINLAKKNNPTANFSVMDCRQISELSMKFDGIICGFCLPYLSQTESAKLIFDAANLLTDNGMLYLSFVEGDINKSGFQVGSSGDRVFFYYQTLDQVKTYLADNKFEDLKLFKVEYEKSRSEIDIHTILTARRKTTA